MRYVAMVLFAAFVLRRAVQKPRALLTGEGLLADVPGRTLRRGLDTGRVHLEITATQVELATQRSTYLALPSGHHGLSWAVIGPWQGLGLVLEGSGSLGRTTFVTRTSATQVTELLRSVGWTVADPPVGLERLLTRVSAGLLLVVVEALIYNF